MTKPNNEKADASSTSTNILQLPTDVIGMARNRLSTFGSMFRCPESPRSKQKPFTFNYFLRTRSPDKYRRQASEVANDGRNQNLLRKQSSVDDGRLSRSLPGTSSETGTKPTIENICLFPRLVLPLKGSDGNSQPDHQDNGRPRKKLSFREPEVIGAVSEEVKSNVAEVIEVAVEAAALAAAAWNIDDDMFVMDDDAIDEEDENDIRLEHQAMEIVNAVGCAFDVCQKIPPVIVNREDTAQETEEVLSEKNNQTVGDILKINDQPDSPKLPSIKRAPDISFSVHTGISGAPVSINQRTTQQEHKTHIGQSSELENARAIPINQLYKTLPFTRSLPSDLVMGSNSSHASMSNAYVHKEILQNEFTDNSSINIHRNQPLDLSTHPRTIQHVVSGSNNNGQSTIPINSSNPATDDNICWLKKHMANSNQNNVDQTLFKNDLNNISMSSFQTSHNCDKNLQNNSSKKGSQYSVTCVPIEKLLPPKANLEANPPEQIHQHSSRNDQPNLQISNPNVKILPMSAVQLNHLPVHTNYQQKLQNCVSSIPISHPSSIPTEQMLSPTLINNQPNPQMYGHTNHPTLINNQPNPQMYGHTNHPTLRNDLPNLQTSNRVGQMVPPPLRYQLNPQICSPFRPLPPFITLRGRNIGGRFIPFNVRTNNTGATGHDHSESITTGNDDSNVQELRPKFLAEFHQAIDRVLMKKTFFDNLYQPNDVPPASSSKTSKNEDKLSQIFNEYHINRQKFNNFYYKDDYCIHHLWNPSINQNDIRLHYQNQLQEIMSKQQNGTEMKKEIFDALEDIFERLTEDETYILSLMKRLDNYQEHLFFLYESVWFALKNSIDFQISMEMFHSICGCNAEKSFFLNSYNKLNRCLDYLTLCISSLTIDCWQDEHSMKNNDLPQMVQLEKEDMQKRAMFHKTNQNFPSRSGSHIIPFPEPCEFTPK